MKNSTVLRLAVAAVIFAIAVWPMAALPQDAKPKSDDLAIAVADATKANMAAMQKYTWRVKTNLAKDGESMATSVSEMRFSTEGKLESTNIGGESNIEKKPGLRGRQQEKKMKEFGEYLQGVLAHSFQYIFMSKGTLVDVFDRAKIKETEGGIDVAAGDLFVKGDELLISVDPVTRLAQKLSFRTTLDKDTITGAVTFAKIEDGPNRPTRLEIEIPTQAVKITSETYDWILQK
jgi:hypothetical protein